MTRALHVIDTLGRGGAEQLLVTLLPAVRSYGVSPIVAVLNPPYNIQHDLEEHGVTVIRVPAFPKWNLLRGRQVLKALCAEHTIDIVHAHLFFPGLYGGMLALGSAIPTFETFHNLAYAGANKDNFKLRFRKAIRKWLARRSGTQFLAVSEAVATHYSAELGIDAITTLPNVVDVTQIEKLQNDTQQMPRQSDRLTIILPGRLVPEKGHSDLLDALTKANLPPFTLEFLGGGPLEAALADRAHILGIPLTISGAVPHDEFLSRLATADICVVPSRYEGFGIAAAEAMALGIPVISTDVGGLPEVVGNAGIIVPVGEVGMLRNAISDLACNSERRAFLGSVGAKHVRDQFSPNYGAKKLAELYHSAILQTRHMSGGNAVQLR